MMIYLEHLRYRLRNTEEVLDSSHERDLTVSAERVSLPDAAQRSSEAMRGYPPAW
jgi:adenylosuccinate lyase